MLIVFFLFLHCHFIYSALVDSYRNATVPRVNQTAHDYPDYEMFRPEPERNLDYDLFPTQTTRKFPQLVTLPDPYPMTPRGGLQSTSSSNSIANRYGNGYTNEYRGRNNNAFVMGNPRMRYRPSAPRNPSYPQQNVYGSPMGYSYAETSAPFPNYDVYINTMFSMPTCETFARYSDVAAHFLELVGDEDWQRQLQVDLQQITGQVTFPYIFICGTHIGGSSDLFGLHQSGQLRTMLNNCSPRKE